jgi:hypothetical protein
MAIPTETASSAFGLPFYQRPVALCGDAHRYRGLVPGGAFGFASKTVAIPLGAGEFFPAARHYPIVFSPGNQPTPLVITGLFEGHNLFVDGRGDWRADHYVPGYLRRYPFLLGGSAGAGPESAILVIDEACDRFADSRENRRVQRLFDDTGNTTALTQEAMSLCVAAYHEEARTAAFTRALHDAGLLVDSHVQFNTSSGQKQTVQGFRLVDNDAYRALPSATLSHWFSLGWLDAIALQIASQQNWNLLIAHHERMTADHRASGDRPH